MNTWNPAETRVGLIGLGAMGSGMAANLLRAGCPLQVYDLNAERTMALESGGAAAADNVRSLVRDCEIVLLSLPNSEVTVKVMESEVIPGLRPGQILIDLGTVTPPDARRLAADAAARGAFLLDAPVAGGAGGARSGMLHMFVGGDPDVYARCRPLLELLGSPEHITYGGPSGSGQILKCVNQMIMGLVNAAYLEPLAMGVLAGIDAQTVRDAMTGEQTWRKEFCAIADKVIAGQGIGIGVKFGQFPYFLQEAEEKGFELPLSKALFEFCDPGERVVMEVNRLSPSFWIELQKHANKPG